MKVDTVTKDTTRYSYDAFGSLRSIQLPNGTLLEYLIDGSGRRVGRKVNGVVTQKWLYSSDLGITAELDSANNIASRFVYVSSENVPEYFTKSGVLYRVVTDHLGSVRQVINAQTGAIVQSVDYDEYGDVLVDTNPGFTPFGFAGGLLDSKTGLTRFGMRDYDASIGRWVAKDPILFQGSGTNLYVYCINDPVNLLDPTGKLPLSPKQIGLAFGLGLIQAGFAVLRGDDWKQVIQSFAIGALTGLIGGAEWEGVTKPMVGMALGFGANFLSQTVVRGRSWSEISAAQLAFTSIAGFASGAYGALFNQDLAGTAVLITVFVAIQQQMLLMTVH
jgi:RHS repeat-associated protein